MASTPFTLAALATSAVPGLEVTGTRSHTSGSGGAFTSAVLTTERGEVIVRVPVHSNAEVQQSGELLGLAALTEGTRAELPFKAATTLGITRAGDSRAVVSTFLQGTPATHADFEEDPALQQSVAEVLAAIHGLPTGVVRQSGLPARDAEEVRTLASRLVQRTTETGLLPSTVQKRWAQALDADMVWSFEPTVVHGSIDPEQLLIEGGAVTGVLGWNELALGDPAIDLAWLMAASNETTQTTFAHYVRRRDTSELQKLMARARFYHELEIAKWLLHGIESHDQGIVDDAVSMLDRLVDNLGLLGAPTPMYSVLSEHEVERMLEDTPHVDVDLRSETAEFEALDEDRVFESDSDFDEPASPLKVDKPDSLHE